MKKIFLIFILGVLSLTSCGKFLDDYSQNLSYVTDITDLDEMLVGDAYWSSATTETLALWHLNIMDDDVTSTAYGASKDTPTSMGERMKPIYAWQEYCFRDEENDLVPGSPYSWELFYKRISACNVILNEVERFAGEAKYDKVKGEALFLRAFYYSYMVNIWAKPYDVTTASTDLAVPIKTSPAVEDKDFERNTVAECYAQIIADAKAAAEHLDKCDYVSTWRTSAAAAHALLARTYLYMCDYANAEAEADKVLTDARFGLIDMNVTGGEDYADIKLTDECSELLFTSGSTMYLTMQKMYWAMKPSQELLDCYESDDLRYIDGSTDGGFFESTYVYGRDRFGLPYSMAGKSDYSGYGITLPEVYLIKAEAAAMSGRDTEACTTLNTLRSKRMSANSDVNLGGEELVKFVRLERRRELCFQMHRWFDLRRYAVCAKYPETKTIRHDLYEYDATTRTPYLAGYYELGTYPEDGAWVMPFPNETILNNTAIIQNERPERPLLTIE